MLDRLQQALSDRYRIEREVGRGGMASVWLARDLRLDRAVAIKVLHPALAGAIGADRFLREIHFATRLEHPAIVPVLDTGVFTGPGDVLIPWYSMPYITGESLRARLDREKRLPVEEAVRLTQEAAEALARAHRAGIVHRDIKPENLLLADGHLYVADFGIAKALLDTGGERLTSTGMAIGTPLYMSPEQASAESVDARSDQYSLGCVLYEMLVGEAPFTGPTAQAIVARRLAEPARAIRPVRSTVSEGLEAAVLRSLERVPADRFPDVSAFARAVASPIPPKPRARPAVVPTLIATLIIAAVGFGAWRVGHRRDSVTVSLYQRGMHESAKRTPAGVRAGVQLLSQAVARDSSYTEAWAALGRDYVRVTNRRFDLPGISPDSALRLAIFATDRALAGNHNDAGSWLTRALVSRALDPTDLTPVLSALRQSVRLDSTSSEAWLWLAMSLYESGQRDSALAAWHRSVAIDSSYSEGLALLAVGYYWAARYDSAAYWADSAVSVDPSYLLGRGTAGLIEIERGNYPRAIEQVEAARRLATDVELANALAEKALAQARSGATREARATLQSADSVGQRFVPAASHTAVWLAQAWAALGDADRAMAWLRRVQPVGDAHFQLHLRCDPPFRPLEKDPRFKALLRRPRPAAGC